MSFPRTPVLSVTLLALLTAAPGCMSDGGDEPERSAGSSLRLRFPDQAGMVLDQERSFVATGEGFTRRAAESDASPHKLVATLPRDGADAVRLRIDSEFEVSVRELDVVGEGQPTDHAVSYRRAGGTSFWTAVPSGMEEWLHLDAGVARTGETVAAWEVTGATLQQHDDAVEILDAGGLTRLRVTAPAAYVAGGREVKAHLAVRDARIELSVDAGGEEVLVDPAWTPVTNMSATRSSHSATRLQNDKVLVVGGIRSSTVLGTTDLFDPATNHWASAGTLITARHLHTATILPNGKVLVVGGFGATTGLSTVELYDPATNLFSAATSLLAARWNHTATLLPNGKVLVAGGSTTGTAALSTTEIYDPATNSWAAGALMSVGRVYQTATLLQNGIHSGKVFVVGGQTWGLLASTELYDPTTNVWTAGAPFANARAFHTATLLANGKVLIAGGTTGNSALDATTEIYTPSTNKWKASGSMSVSRYRHQATLLPSGKVIVEGGFPYFPPGSTSSTVDLYNPLTNTWSTTASMSTSRYDHTSTPLTSGKVLVAGGVNDFGATDGTSEIYDADLWSPTNALSAARTEHTATKLADGNVLVTGGQGTSFTHLTSSELYDSASGVWGTAGALSLGRARHTASLLQSGKVLAAGGRTDGFGSAKTTATAEVYTPATNLWQAAGPMNAARESHTAIVLSNGKVLVAGGGGPTGYLASVELFDPATNTWSYATPMNTARAYHSATLLQDGEVLVAGGLNNASSNLASAEIYDPTTNSWSMMAPMNAGRWLHMASRLANGQVLVAGGIGGNPLSSAELYDPANDVWTPAASMSTERYRGASTLLANDEVLIAGGGDLYSNYLASTEVYNAVADAWTLAPSLSKARVAFTTTLLGNGQVLATGGSTAFGIIASSELYP
ncbi:kelch repeat-containing protein [Sorangium sp. So ce887]|uniref:kelch repeat-containing protein n=1 Tax=Sorangium sp. So ce887 TaxID=3133324 RepID=UPI003F5F955B